MDFVALDVETANPDLSSICQIGLAFFSGGQLERSVCRYVNPKTWFDELNIGIHGISERDVRGAPTFQDIYPWLTEELTGQVVVTHTRFDVSSISRACDVAQLQQPSVNWLDSASVSRRTWEWCSQSGYGLSPLCEKFGIVFKHHNAEQDAIAAGKILLKAMEDSGRTLDDYMSLVKRPIPFNKAEIKDIQSNPDGEYFGQVLVFTGTLRLPRLQAAQLAAKHGFTVLDGVSKKVDILVVGDQDIRKLAGNEKSSKYRKAEELQTKGVSIRILKESDFEYLVRDI